MANFLFGITGSISLYKTIDILSSLKKSGEKTSVILTPMAEKFVSLLTFATFADGKAYVNWSKDNPILHIELAKWADVFVVAPASANTISAAANGLGNNLLLSTILAYEKPIYFVPAMNTKMYENQAIQRNLEILKNMGHFVIEPDSGILACGDTGKGRFPSPKLLYDYLKDIYLKRKKLEGKKVLVSAGPAKEDIDPVRYITNRSSGKMGYALALEAIKRNAKVTLVSGETNLNPPIGLEKLISVRSAEDFFENIKKIYKEYDIIIMAAAIADYTPVKREKNKIKKSSTQLQLSLKRTEDVLEYLGKHKIENQTLVGFAAETTNVIENARKKLEKKKIDFIVANNVSSSEVGFQSNFNAATIIARSGHYKDIDRCSKEDLARYIFDFVMEN